jgi:hypothetical protein
MIKRKLKILLAKFADQGPIVRGMSIAVSLIGAIQISYMLNDTISNIKNIRSIDTSTIAFLCGLSLLLFIVIRSILNDINLFLNKEKKSYVTMGSMIQNIIIKKSLIKKPKKQLLLLKT